MKDVDCLFCDAIRSIQSHKIGGIVAHDAVHVLPLFRLSDLDRSLCMKPRVAT